MDGLWVVSHGVTEVRQISKPDNAGSGKNKRAVGWNEGKKKVRPRLLMDLDRGKNRTVQVFSLDDGWLREKCEGKVIQFIDKDWQKNFKINRLVSDLSHLY